ncbi:hypothetical protein EL22_26265 [Halostagnicola sp. A56]|nr:hypothetical protein EL22_26265 [Halostagnicola sp. A56]
MDEVRDPSEAKSRLKTEIASPEELREILEIIYQDLERIEAYHCRVREQPGGRWTWSDQVLPKVQREVEQLSLLFNRWEQESQRKGRNNVRGVLADALQPLHEGLDELNQALNGKYSIKEREMARQGKDSVPKELADDYRSLEARREALLALLEDAELRVIFHYVENHEGEKLPKRTRGENLWSWWTSRFLRGEYGLVEDSAWGFRLTNRGELVSEVLWNLEEKPLLELLGEGAMPTAEAALKLLPHHVGADRWKAWENV